jgi:hypothetical protein
VGAGDGLNRVKDAVADVAVIPQVEHKVFKFEVSVPPETAVLIEEEIAEEKAVGEE